MKRSPYASKAAETLAAGERSRRDSSRSRVLSLSVDTLELRQMLTADVAAALPAAVFVPTSTNIADAQNGPMANMGTKAISLYQAYTAGMAKLAAVAPPSAGTAATQVTALNPTIQSKGGMIGMDVNSLGGDFNAFLSQLKALGMQVTTSSADYGIAEGYVPLSALPSIARLPQTLAASPITVATTHAFKGFQGVAYNEAETSMNADAARSQYGLTGAGVTIGVISDSVSAHAGGLQDSYNSGDLDPNNPVKVIQDIASGSDEGRAMLEGVHDIAPAANLQFATGFTGSLGFMQNIEAMYTAGAKVIVDDLSLGDEPYFQDGLISQGVDFVTARGTTYFSSAGNGGSDSGYLSNFRSVNTTVNGIAGTWDNFNPNGGAANALLPVTATGDNLSLQLQFDQPFRTQEPAGSTASVTSNVDFYVFDSAGNVVASGTDNNVATQQPLQNVTVPSAGNYFVGIQLVSGTAPGHVEFLEGGGNIQVSKQYGSAGGTFYPDAFGHEVAAATIGVGATNWWAPSPFLAQGPLLSASGSSTGPGLIDLSPKGTPVTPLITQSPAITAPQGGTTSFFGAPDINTTQFDPTTPYNFVPENQQARFSFFGTSQSAPNVAAVAVLMLQESPSLSRAQILKALETTATPMNGTPAGSYNIQSGYGEVNAVAAIKSIAPATTLKTSTAVLTSSITTPTAGTAFNLKATISGANGTPTGTVDVYDISYNSDLGTVSLSGGLATLTNTPSIAGAHVFLLTYNGNSTYSKSTGYLVLNILPATNGLHRSGMNVPVNTVAPPTVIIDPSIEARKLIRSR